MTFEDIADLLTYLEADGLEAAGHVISEETDPDTWIEMDEGQLVLGVGSTAIVLEFPLSLIEFWDMIDELESDAVATISREEEQTMEWDSPDLFPTHEPARVATYRRLQSWYREQVLGAKAGTFRGHEALGSYLDVAEVTANPRLNFLSDAALVHAEERIGAVSREGGSLDPVRLRHNMLSSMPLCFNLFGTMRAEPAFLHVFQELFDPEATEITDIVCEWAPQPTSDFLGDRTAFDAVIFYETIEGERFCGIETKYTESFSVTEYDNPTYASVTRDSGWFTDPDEAVKTLVHRRSNQLWRNVLLAAAIERHGSRGSGRVAVVCLADDPGALAATAAVSSALKDQERLKLVSMESIVDGAAKHPGLAPWAREFRRRYISTSTSTTAQPERDS